LAFGDTNCGFWDLNRQWPNLRTLVLGGAKYIKCLRDVDFGALPRALMTLNVINVVEVNNHVWKRTDVLPRSLTSLTLQLQRKALFYRFLPSLRETRFVWSKEAIQDLPRGLVSLHGEIALVHDVPDHLLSDLSHQNFALPQEYIAEINEKLALLPPVLEQLQLCQIESAVQQHLRFQEPLGTLLRSPKTDYYSLKDPDSSQIHQLPVTLGRLTLDLGRDPFPWDTLPLTLTELRLSTLPFSQFHLLPRGLRTLSFLMDISNPSNGLAIGLSLQRLPERLTSLWMNLPSTNYGQNPHLNNADIENFYVSGRITQYLPRGLKRFGCCAPTDDQEAFVAGLPVDLIDLSLHANDKWKACHVQGLPKHLEELTLQEIDFSVFLTEAQLSTLPRSLKELHITSKDYMHVISPAPLVQPESLPPDLTSLCMLNYVIEADKLGLLPKNLTRLERLTVTGFHPHHAALFPRKLKFLHNIYFTTPVPYYYFKPEEFEATLGGLPRFLVECAFRRSSTAHSIEAAFQKRCSQNKGRFVKRTPKDQGYWQCVLL
jgi:hypothetical protein